MKIVLVSPLYPPDIAAPAQYTRELARRLAAAHEVVLVVYGRLPEPAAGARIIAIDKRPFLPFRLARFFLALWRAARGADAVYLQNGPSVELPAALLAWTLHGRLFLHFSDQAAHLFAQKHFWRRTIERFVLRRAQLITDAPEEKPEILPLEEPPTEALKAWEAAWQRHTSELEKRFSHA